MTYSLGDARKKSITYDHLDRVVSETRPDGTQVFYEHDGLELSVIDPLGRLSRVKKDISGQVVYSVDPGENTTEFTYDARGQMLATLVNGKLKTSAKYDIQGRRTYFYTPETGGQEVAWSALGGPVVVKRVDGQTSQITYDRLGRMTKKRVFKPGSSDNQQVIETLILKAYDTERNGIGLLASESRGKFMRLYAYDQYARPHQVITRIYGEEFVTKNTFDHLGRVDQTIFPSDLSIRYAYDDQGFHVATSNAQTGEEYWRLDATGVFGQITQSSFGNGVKQSFSYDELRGHLTSN